MQALLSRIRLTGLVVLLCLPSSWALADDLFQGRAIPPTLQFKDITQGWKHIELPDTSVVPLLLPLIAQETGKQYLLPPRAYYTRGERITCGQETYLIAYRQEHSGIDTGELLRWLSRLDEERHEMVEEERRPDAEMNGQEAEYPPFYAPPPITPDATLHLCLLNVKSLTNIANIRNFDLAREMQATNEARLKGIRARSLFNLRRLCDLLREYLDEHEGTFPKLTGAREIRETLRASDEIMLQPMGKTPYLSNPGLAGMQREDIPTPAETPVFYEATPGVDGKRGVAFLDGRARIVTAEEWEALKKIWGLP